MLITYNNKQFDEFTTEIAKTKLGLFANTCPRNSQRILRDWFVDQSFDVYEITNYPNNYYISEIEHFIMMRLVVPEIEWIVLGNQPSKYFPFYLEWRRGFDERQEAYKAYIRNRKSQTD